MAYLEFIHNLVETLDKYFENVCELDVHTFQYSRLCLILKKPIIF